jgi:hypothetical protein
MLCLTVSTHIGFQISVNEAVGAHVLESLEDLSDDETHVELPHWLLKMG